MYNRVAQKKKKICDRLELMDKVIIKCFYFYYLRFRQLFERALLKNQNQKIFSMERSQQGMPLKIIREAAKIKFFFLVAHTFSKNYSNW